MIIGTIVSLKEQYSQVSIACIDGIFTLKYTERSLSICKTLKIGDFILAIPQRKVNHYLFIIMDKYSNFSSHLMYSCLNLIA